MDNSLKKNIKHSIFWKLLEKGSVQGINLIVQIILARLLLPTDFGNLAIIVAITNYASLFVQSGISTIIIQRKDIDDQDISSLLCLSLFVATLIYCALFFLAPIISGLYNTDELTWPLRVLSLILFLNSFYAVQIGIYSKGLHFKKIFIRSIIAVPVSGAVGIIMATLGYGIWSLVIHNLLNMFLVVIIMAFDKEVKIHFGFSMSSIKRLFKELLIILSTGLITGGNDLIRTVLIGKRYSSEDLAYYDKAYTYSGYATLIVGQTITGVMLPSLSMVQDNAKELKTLARKSIAISCFIMFPVLLGITAVSEPFVFIVLTEKWKSVIPFLMIFCILRMPGFISSVDKQVFYSLGKNGLNLAFEVINLIVNVFVILTFLNSGVITIAICATIVEWAICILLFPIAKRVYNYTIFERIQDIWKPLVSSIVMFLITLFVGKYITNLYFRFAIQIIIGGITYVASSLLLKDQNMVSLIHKIKTLNKAHIK